MQPSFSQEKTCKINVSVNLSSFTHTHTYIHAHTYVGNKDKRDLQNLHLVADFGIDVALDFRTAKSRFRREDKSITARPIKAEVEGSPGDDLPGVTTSSEWFTTQRAVSLRKRKSAEIFPARRVAEERNKL